MPGELGDTGFGVDGAVALSDIRRFLESLGWALL
jgi:hypothetical protein